jgi:GNAT superfamily N-acetyltransferase
MFRPAQDTPEDIAFILKAHRDIEGTDARLTEQRLKQDMLSGDPKAYVDLLEDRGEIIGMILYARNYWASVGVVLWVSQMYILPAHRGRFVYRLKDWANKKCREWDSRVIAWGTHRAADRSSRLWQAAGAKDISDGYSFWIKKIEG